MRFRRRAARPHLVIRDYRGINFFGRCFRSNPNETLNNSDEPFARETGHWCSEERATLVTSLLGPRSSGMHAPVLDFDLPCQWVESSTPGHGHLYINKAMPWADVAVLLRALCAVGLIEPGFRDASIARGYTAVRVPWVKKGDI